MISSIFRLLKEILFENVFESSSRTNARANKRIHSFDFLDGFRGFCALTVVISHSVTFLKSPHDYEMLNLIGLNFGVSGFFLLSSFLLTYNFARELDTEFDRLDLVQEFTILSRTNVSLASLRRVLQLKAFLLITLKYCLKRFFRIYLGYVIFVAFSTPPLTRQAILLEYMQMDDTNHHLWTMPVEIRYYFFIPFICLLFVKMREPIRRLFYLLIASFVLLNEKYKFIGDSKKTLELTYSLPIFLSGSIIGFMYYFKNKNTTEKLSQSCLKNFIASSILTAATLVVFYHYNTKWNFHTLTMDIYFRHLSGRAMFRLSHYVQAGVTFSYIFLLMVFTAPTAYTNLFKESKVFNAFGKYSYGTYLIHLLVVHYIVERRFYTDFETIVVICLCSLACGFLFYYVVENPLMNIASILCRKISQLEFFQQKSSKNEISEN